MNLRRIRACWLRFRGLTAIPTAAMGVPGFITTCVARGLRISRHRVARLMRVHGIRGVCRRSPMEFERETKLVTEGVHSTKLGEVHS